MAAVFALPKATAFDGDGLIISGATLNFYEATTTTPKAVYSDSTLMTAITQPIEADDAGRFPLIYMATGAYKIVLKDDEGSTIYTADNLDSGIPAGSGAVAVNQGGTGATTAAGARTNLAAAAQSEVDTLASSVAAIEAEITGVGGSLGDLAGLDEITRGELATGFGVVTLKRTLVDSESTKVTCAGTIPADDTIPQIGEGTEVLSGSYTPVSASSKLRIEVAVSGIGPSNVVVGAALFKNSDADAINARASYSMVSTASTHVFTLDFAHEMDSPGTSPITFSVRLGATSGTSYLNGASSSVRMYGGVQIATLRVIEYLTV